MKAIRRLVSLCLVFTALLLAVTAVVLALRPAPDLAAWNAISFLGLSVARWPLMHLGLGLFFLLLILVNALVNLGGPAGTWRDEEGRIKALGWETFPGVVLVLAVAGASAYSLPPLRQVFDAIGEFRAQTQTVLEQPPFEGAAKATLASLGQRYGFDPEKLQNALAAHHVMVASMDLTVEEVAKRNNISPAGVFAAIRPTTAQTVPSPLPSDPPSGLAMMTLAEICSRYGLDTAKVTAKLAAIDIRAGAAMTVSEIAKVNRRLPVEIYESLRLAAQGAPGQAGHGEPAPKPAEPDQSKPAQVMPAPLPAPPVPQPGEVQAKPQPAPAEPEPAKAPPDPGAVKKIEPPVGLGKMLLSEFCKANGIDQKEAVKKLEAKNILAFGDMTFNEIALEYNLTPKAVMEIVVN